MFCYVKGISKHNDGAVADKCDEDARYQWLPSEFTIRSNGSVTVSSYINNLDRDKNPDFIPLIEEIFSCFIPSLERILNKNIRGRDIQVIVKVGSTILTPENNKCPNGSWHIEGVLGEHVSATCIHYVNSDNIANSYLEFRKPTIVNETNIDYPQDDRLYTSHHYGIEGHFDGVMNRYLGLIHCKEGAPVIFPNSLQHRVKEFSSNNISESSLRTILAFFVIDPDHRIISTKDIPPQQELFSLDEAKYHRERLMFHRKYFVNKLNETVFERSFSLCEH